MRLPTAAVGEDEHWWLIVVIRSTAARGQATRARLPVALAALLSRRHVQIVDFHCPFEVRSRRVQRPQESLNAPVDRFVGDSELGV
jgi:hypothetical protein